MVGIIVVHAVRDRAKHERADERGRPPRDGEEPVELGRLLGGRKLADH
ncbi:hypothetical protein SDC9_209244 [bioreactor metagenome]|uniref:Uncharacterized protein n=1 Tax=bioreactor metagenome TaxID=1076179 RepID=A0A645JDG8_9ZZZZ